MKRKQFLKKVLAMVMTVAIVVTNASNVAIAYGADTIPPASSSSTASSSSSESSSSSSESSSSSSESSSSSSESSSSSSESSSSSSESSSSSSESSSSSSESSSSSSESSSSSSESSSSSSESSSSSSEAEKCVCKSLCTEDAANKDCAVCAADIAKCEGKEKCVCTELCTKDKANKDCAVCAADIAKCEGKEKCVCTELCTKDKANKDCAVCAADIAKCEGKEKCVCTELCTKDKANKDCAVCAADIAKCEGKKCVCTELCTKDKTNKDCPICMAGIAACLGKKPDQGRAATIVWVKSTGADANDGSETSPYKTLKKAYDSVNAGGKIVVLDTVPVGTADVITVTKNVTILGKTAGSGAKLKRASGNIEILINITSGNVTLENISVDGGSFVQTQTASNNKGQLVAVNGGNLTLNTGAVLENNMVSYAGAAGHIGSAIHLTTGSVTMEDGSVIRNNKVTNGSAAAIAAPSQVAGTITINGGTITNNTADSAGSAIRFVKTGAIFKMLGGSIVDNGVTNYGSVTYEGTMTVGGDAVIKGGDGLALYVNSTITVNDDFTGAIEFSLTGAAPGKQVTVGGGTKASQFTYVPGDLSVVQGTGANAGNLYLGALSDVFISAAGNDSNAGTKAAPVKTLLAAYNKVNAGGKIYVIGEVPVATADVISSATKKITIEGVGSGAKLKRASGNTAVLMTIGAGGDVTLRNVSLDGGGFEQVMSSNDRMGQLVNLLHANGKLTLDTGAVLENNKIKGTANAAYGGAIYLSQGAIELKAGSSIRNNTLTGDTSDGAAISCVGGTITMNGGTITGNTAARYGSAIRLSIGNLIMNSGSITGNSSSAYGSVALIVSGLMTIAGDAVVKDGGGVFVGTSKTITVDDNFTGSAEVTTETATVGTVITTGGGTKASQFTYAPGGYSIAAGTGANTGNLVLAVLSDVYVSNAGLDTNPGTQAKPFKTLKKAYDVVSAGGTIHVIGEVPVATADVLSGSNNITKKITIEGFGAGAKLKRADGTGGTVKNEGTILIQVNTGGDLTLRNISIDGGSFVQTKDATSVLCYVLGTGKLTLDSGTVLENNKVDHASGQKIAYGGGACVGFGGTLNILPGSIIRNNQVTGNFGDGAAISTASGGGIVNMSGGLITGNKSTRLGVVRLVQLTFNMSGGEISGNESTNMSAATGLKGASVSMYNATALNLSGTAVIKDGGGVYVDTGKTINVDSGFTGSVEVTTETATVGTVITTGGGTKASQFTYAPGGYSIAAGTGANANNLVLAVLSDVYVSKAGLDTNPGTQAKPFKTLKKAYDVVSAGGTIHVIGEVPVATADVLSGSNNITKKITIEGFGAGAKLKRADGTGGTVKNEGTILIQVNTGGDLTLKNISIDGGSFVQTKDATSVLCYVLGTGKLTLDSGTVLENNKVDHASGQKIAYGGGACVGFGGTLNVLPGSIIRNNQVTGKFGDGAAISSAQDGGTVNMSGGLITGNKSTRFGVVRLVQLTFNMSGGEISGNESTNMSAATSFKGASVSMYNATALNLSGTAVIKDGGGVYVDTGKTINVDSGFTGSVEVTTQTATVGTVITTGGGTKASQFTYVPGNLSIMPGTGANAGNLYLSLLSDTYVSSTGNDTTGNGTVAKPYATLKKAYDVVPTGGKIHIMDTVSQPAAANITAIKTVTIDNKKPDGSTYPNAKLLRAAGNTANFIIVSTGGNVTLDGVVLDGNKAVVPSASALVNVSGGYFGLKGTLQNNVGGVYSYNNAGALYIASGEATMYSGAIQGNAATYGGGVLLRGGTFLMVGGTITGNNAITGGTGYGGGGLWNYGGTVILRGGSITGNTSASPYKGVVQERGILILGGMSGYTPPVIEGLHFYANNFVTMESTFAGSVTNLTVADMPAAVGAQRVLSATSPHTPATAALFKTLDTNYAVIVGAGNKLVISKAEKTAVYVSKTGNDITGDGTQAKPYLTLKTAYNAVAANGTINVIGEVSVAAADTIVSTKNYTIAGVGSGAKLKRAAGNSAILINMTSGNVTLKNVSLDGGGFVQNIASNHGVGQLVQVTGGNLTLDSGAVLENNKINATTIADYGSAIFINAGTVNLKAGSVIRNNAATGAYPDGAAICSIGTGTINMSGGSITGNAAARNGSAIRLSGTAFNMSGGSITGNGDSSFGTVGFFSGTMTVSGDATIQDGGGAYLVSGRTIKVETGFTGDIDVTTQKTTIGTQVTTGGGTLADQFTYVPGGMQVAAGSGASAANLYLATVNDSYVSSKGNDTTGTGSEGRPYATLKKAYDAVPAGGKIHIMDTVSQPAAANISATKSVTIDNKKAGGGTYANAKLLRAAGNTGNFIVVSGAGDVTLDGVVLDGNKSVVANANALVNVSGGKFALKGTLQNNNRTGMSGYSDAGGLFIAGGEATMSGGAIQGNSTTYGGGVLLRGGKFIMTGGTITGNNAITGGTGYGGGGLWNYGGDVTLQGGSITGNTSASPYKGVVHERGTLSVSGNPTIEGLHFYGGMTMQVGNGFAGAVSKVTVADVPAAGKERRLSTVAFSGYDATKFTTELAKCSIEKSTDNYIVLKQKNQDATLTSLTYTAPGSSEASVPSFNPATLTYSIEIPYEPVTGTLTVKAAAKDANATITANATQTADIVGWAENTTKAFTFKVTAEDGTTVKTYTVNVKRAPQKEKVFSFNFDRTAGDRTNSTAKITFAGVSGITGSDPWKLAKNADGSGTLAVTTGLGTPTNSGNDITVIAAKDYADALDSGSKWQEVTVEGAIKISQYNEDAYLYKGSTYIGKVKLSTANASLSDMGVVKAIFDQLNGFSYSDAYELAADAAAGHPQATGGLFADKPVATDANANAYIKAVADKEVATLASSNADIQAAINGDKLLVKVNSKSFVAATAGTAANPNGYDGSYTFTITVTCGAQSVTQDKTIKVLAHKYSGVSELDLIAALKGALENGDGTAKLAGTVYVDAEAKDDVVTAEVKAKMSGDIKAAVSALTLSGAVCSTTDADIVVKAAALADGNYTATVTAKAVKSGTTTTVTITVPLKMIVKYRPSVDDLVGEALAKAIENALAGNSLKFDDVTDDVNGAYRTEDKLAAYVSGKMSATLSIPSVTVDLRAKNPDGTPDTGDTADSAKVIQLTGYTITPVVSGLLNAPVPGTADASLGQDGQYIFSANLNVGKGDYKATQALNITAATSPVVKGASSSDTGVYITAFPYQGVSNEIAVQVAAALFDGKEPSGAFKLTYAMRNDASTRAAMVTEWANGVITSAKSVKLGSDTYTLENGKITKKNGKAFDAKLVTDLSGAAMANMESNETMELFTSTSSAASTVDISNKYEIALSVGTASSKVPAKEMPFAHGKGSVKGKIEGGTAPFTMTLINKETGVEIIIPVNPDGSYELPESLPDGDYLLTVRDKDNRASSVTEIKIPAQTEGNTVNMREGALVKGRVTLNNVGMKGAKVTAGTSQDTTTVGDGIFAMAPVAFGRSVSFAAEYHKDSTNAAGAVVSSVPPSNDLNIAMVLGIQIKSKQRVTLSQGTPAVGAKVSIDYDGKTYTGLVDDLGFIMVSGVPQNAKTVDVTVTDRLGRTASAKGCAVTLNDSKTIGTVDLGADPFIIKPKVSGLIIGELKDEDGAVITGATIDLIYENNKVSSTKSDDSGNFQFADLAYGVYKLVVTLPSGSIKTLNFGLDQTTSGKTLTLVLPVGEKSTEVNSTNDLVQLTADIPNSGFKPTTNPNQGFTAAEVASGDPLKLILDAIGLTTDGTSAKNILSTVKKANAQVAYILDLKLSKQVGSTKTQLSGLKDAIEVVYEVPEEYQTKTSELEVWYEHEGTVKKHGNYSFKKVGELYYVYIYANEFSSYAMVHNRATSTGGSSDSGSGSSGSGIYESDNDFWATVNAAIPNTNKVLEIDARPYDSMPFYVMDTLRQHNVTLIINWASGQIVIPAGMAQPHDLGRIYWPFSLLKQLYAKAARNGNPETGGPIAGSPGITISAPKTAVLSTEIASPDSGMAKGATPVLRVIPKISRMSKCSMCTICPAPLGMCAFIWLAIIVFLTAAAALFIVGKRRNWFASRRRAKFTQH